MPPRVSPTLVTPLMTKCSQCGPAASNRWTLTFKPILHVYIVRPPCTALFAELKPHLNRAGFNTLSRALFRKKCGALQLWRQTLFFSEKNRRPFLVITVLVSLSVHSGIAHFSGMQKYPLLLWGPLFVVAPGRPNMPNMPKSAAALINIGFLGRV